MSNTYCSRVCVDYGQREAGPTGGGRDTAQIRRTSQYHYTEKRKFHSPYMRRQ